MLKTQIMYGVQSPHKRKHGCAFETGATTLPQHQVGPAFGVNYKDVFASLDDDSIQQPPHQKRRTGISEPENGVFFNSSRQRKRTASDAEHGEMEDIRIADNSNVVPPQKSRRVDRSQMEEQSANIFEVSATTPALLPESDARSLSGARQSQLSNQKGQCADGNDRDLKFSVIDIPLYIRAKAYLQDGIPQEMPAHPSGAGKTSPTAISNNSLISEPLRNKPNGLASANATTKSNNSKNSNSALVIYRPLPSASWQTNPTSTEEPPSSWNEKVASPKSPLLMDID
ncbi:hypothetical protein GGI25_006114 [Coemansia spiralis]|uniref:Uncharacterized protein n=2 Tax=Coemansia TaxID=4863 RepID=A0A9W8FXG9_9FUNG|nr:hypothetical protein BX070DRAFT_80870 [Coemansia spiralis]KAJ1986965.1 hypothetical protein EDC05_006068 [Coemansia umbellata]KAJ2618998.1 hypothetical protein GGI26_006187 [Coemansia sp. RSA 1358]KAJ2669536.1 hypothetical protein GGI25_006114 [Coemansia spiralis]